MSVPFVDFSREYDEIGESLREAVTRVMESGWFVLDEEVASFESEFAEYVGVSHGVGLNSGSDALELALAALDVGEGDEVIMPAHTFVATANAIVKNDATPVFVDVDQETYCMDVGAFEAAITEDTAAVIPVHLYGHPAEINKIVEIAREHALHVIEDACQAHGATYDGQIVGSFGDISCFSFYPVKNLGAYGDGGMAVTDNDEFSERLRMLRNVGQSKKYHHEIVGVNSRLDELQAAILREKLPHLEKWNERRREAAAHYRDLLANVDVTLPTAALEAQHVYHLFVVRSDQRDKLRAYLNEYNVRTLIHYPTPVHRQPAYADRYRTCHLPVTDQITDEILSLPMHPWITKSEIETVAERIRAFE